MTRPRVEGEAVATVLRYAESQVAGMAGAKMSATLVRDIVLDLLDERAAVARLRAEVERLRGVATDAASTLDLWCGSAGCESMGECEHATQIRDTVFLDSLPTPAPEAQR